MPIEPIKKSNVSEEVFEQMKTLISTGEWKAGRKDPVRKRSGQNIWGQPRIHSSCPGKA